MHQASSGVFSSTFTRKNSAVGLRSAARLSRNFLLSLRVRTVSCLGNPTSSTSGGVLKDE